jgi:hypothetical protein
MRNAKGEEKMVFDLRCFTFRFGVKFHYFFSGFRQNWKYVDKFS